MQKTRTGTTTHGRTVHARVTLGGVSQPRRRRLALAAENAKVRAQARLPSSWTH